MMRLTINTGLPEASRYMNLEYYKAEVRRQLLSKENAAFYSQRKIDVETVF